MILDGLFVLRSNSAALHQPRQSLSGSPNLCLLCICRRFTFRIGWGGGPPTSIMPLYCLQVSSFSASTAPTNHTFHCLLWMLGHLLLILIHGSRHCLHLALSWLFRNRRIHHLSRQCLLYYYSDYKLIKPLPSFTWIDRRHCPQTEKYH